MSTELIPPPFPSFFDDNGKALDRGFIYIGEENKDPETNPITVYWDAGLTIAAFQPIRTTGGYMDRAGSPARVFTSAAYSITVEDKNENKVYTSLSDNTFQELNPVLLDLDTVADMKARGDLSIGQQVITKKYVSNGGGNRYEIVAAGTGTDDSGSFIDLPGSSLQAKALWYNGVQTVLQFGSPGNGTDDDRPAANLAATYAGTIGGQLYFPATDNGYRFEAGTVNLPIGVSVLGDFTTITLTDVANIGSFSYAFTCLGNNHCEALKIETDNATIRYGNGDTDFDTAVDEVQWQTATGYVRGALEFESSLLYRCLITNTSGVFATDLAAGKWELMTDPVVLPLATDTTSFRGGFHGAGVSDVMIKKCDFFAGVHNAIKFDTSANDRIHVSDVLFDGVAAQSLYFSFTSGHVVTNLIARNSGQSRFDHTVYQNRSSQDFAFTNWSIFRCGGVCIDIFADGSDTCNGVVSNITASECRSVLSVAGGSGGGVVKNVRFSNINADHTEKFAWQIIGTGICENIGVVGFNIINNHTEAVRWISAAHKNVSLESFIIDGCDFATAITIESCESPRIKSGSIIDAFAESSRGVIYNASNAFSDLIVDDVDFVWSSDVVAASPILLTTGTGWVRNCTFKPSTTTGRYCIENAAGGIRGMNNTQDDMLGTWHSENTGFSQASSNEPPLSLANLDATPSTSGVSGIFKTTGTTTITDFDNGVIGNTITILATSTITITDSASVILSGGSNYVMTASDTLTLTMFNDQVWQEVGRSVN